MDHHTTFEETYPRYEFAELVRLGIVLGRAILWLIRGDRARWLSTPALDQISATQAMTASHFKP